MVLFTSLPDPLAGGACCPSLRTPPRSRLSASIFGPRASFSSLFLQFSFPPMHRVLIKTLILSIFGAKECTRMQDYVLKIYNKIRGSRPPDPHGGKGDICSHPPPCPPARCWCPLASSRLATALTSAKIWHLLPPLSEIWGGARAPASSVAPVLMLVSKYYIFIIVY